MQFGVNEIERFPKTAKVSIGTTKTRGTGPLSIFGFFKRFLSISYYFPTKSVPSVEAGHFFCFKWTPQYFDLKKSSKCKKNHYKINYTLKINVLFIFNKNLHF